MPHLGIVQGYRPRVHKRDVLKPRSMRVRARKRIVWIIHRSRREAPDGGLVIQGLQVASPKDDYGVGFILI